MTTTTRVMRNTVDLDIALALAVHYLVADGADVVQAAHHIGRAVACHDVIEGFSIAGADDEHPSSVKVCDMDLLLARSPRPVRAGLWLVGDMAGDADNYDGTGWVIAPSSAAQAPWRGAWFEPDYGPSIHFVRGYSTPGRNDAARVDTLTSESEHRSWLHALDELDRPWTHG